MHIYIILREQQTAYFYLSISLKNCFVLSMIILQYATVLKLNFFQRIALVSMENEGWRFQLEFKGNP